MDQHVAATSGRKIARPLKTLIPMIQGELKMGHDAGVEHYRMAGEMLIEAKGQVAHGRWGSWLRKHFELHDRTARGYMQLARRFENGSDAADLPTSLRDVSGRTDRDREIRQSKQNKDFQRILRDIARDEYIQERQARDDEVTLHRNLANELIQVGFRALATKLHPDRGGTKDAMARLNRVRDELESIAATRRYV